jgi:hypothetical protein
MFRLTIFIYAMFFLSGFHAQGDPMAEPVAPCASQLTNDESHESLLDQILAMPLGAPRATTSTALDLGDPLSEESLLMSVLIETEQQRR